MRAGEAQPSPVSQESSYLRTKDELFAHSAAASVSLSNLLTPCVREAQPSPVSQESSYLRTKDELFAHSAAARISLQKWQRILSA
jgi:hypothetical protein